MHLLYLEADLMMLFSVLNIEFQIFQQFSIRDLIQISPLGSLQISVQAVTIQQQYLIMKLRLVYLWQS